MRLVKKFGQPSWRVQSDCVDAWVTRKGGQLAPVNFKIARGLVQPFAIAPWAEEKVSRGFDRVAEIRREDTGVVLRAANGRHVRVPLDVNFLYENAL